MVITYWRIISLHTGRIWWRDTRKEAQELANDLEDLGPGGKYNYIIEPCPVKVKE